MTARNDRHSSQPLPRLIWCGRRISGISPYLAGPKNAACVPISTTHPSTSQTPASSPAVPNQKPTTARPQMPSSSHFHVSSTVRLEKRSATYPVSVQKAAHGA